MARPIKDGLDYFPLNVDFFESEVLEGISGEFGVKGELLTIKLLSTVYKKGYFAVWSDLLQAQLAKKTASSKELANQVVNRLVEWEFFDKDLFNSAKVLTSTEIQEVYFEATKRRKTQKPTEYVINVGNKDATDVVNVDINTQSKGNKTKSNKTKVNNKKTSRKSDKPTYDDDNPNYQLANKLYLAIKNRQEDFTKPNLQNWANDIRLMNERDGRTHKQIENMIDWSQNNDFWSAVILSANKLRKKYDYMKAQALKNARSYSNQQKPVEQGTDWKAAATPKNTDASAEEMKRQAVEELKKAREIYSEGNTTSNSDSSVGSF